MSGRRLVIWFLLLLAVFTAALIYFQFFAYYERDRESSSLTFAGRSFSVSGLDSISGTSSPLKLRACFRTEPETFDGLPDAERPTPLTAPPWFRCFDARRLDAELSSGTARALLLAADEPAGFDVLVAVYPDGRAYLWRQLGAGYRPD